MWYDNWHQLGPLSYVLTLREITNASFNITNKINDVVTHEEWTWPIEWLRIIPQLGDYHVPLDLLERRRIMCFALMGGKTLSFMM